MQNVEVDEEQIAPYIQNISKQLEYLTKEELLKHFVSLEFNRFLEYYKNAEDLNIAEKETRSRRDGRDVERGERSDRGERGEWGKKKSGKKVRLKMNIGRNEGIETRAFLRLINDVTGDKSINIGDIEITGNYSFFDVYEDQSEQVLQAFEQVEDINVSVAKGSKQMDGRDSDRGGSGSRFKTQNRDNQGSKYKSQGRGRNNDSQDSKYKSQSRDKDSQGSKYKSQGRGRDNQDSKYRDKSRGRNNDSQDSRFNKSQSPRSKSGKRGK